MRWRACRYDTVYWVTSTKVKPRGRRAHVICGIEYSLLSRAQFFATNWNKKKITEGIVAYKDATPTWITNGDRLG